MTSNIVETMLLYKYKYWKKGIPAHMFRQELWEDVLDIMHLDEAYGQREEAIKSLHNGGR